MQVIRRVLTFGNLVWKLAHSPAARDHLKYVFERHRSSVTEPPAADGDFIDVNTLLASLSVEDLNRTSDEYYRLHADLAWYLGKPFTDGIEMSDQLIAFGQVAAGLNLTHGCEVLDFGAGTCWSTRFLTQMGCAVTAMDVSPAGLEIGRELFRRLPVVGHHVPPSFVVFDGRRFDLPDESVDRITCLNAFHHVPNPRDVLKEMSRVLRPGGIAGFSEPGAGHSRSAQAQYEMRNFTVLENDIVIDDIERWALEAGFTRLELAVVDSRSYRVGWQEYREFIDGGVAALRYLDTVRDAMWSRRLFFLFKPGEGAPDSRQRRGLNSVARVMLDNTRVDSGTVFTGEAYVENTGTSLWLPSDSSFGPVFLGVHLFSQDGRRLSHDFGRLPLPKALAPGQSATFRFALDAPTSAGEYRLEFDLVSEHVCWFALNGAKVAQVDVSVR